LGEAPFLSFPVTPPEKRFANWAGNQNVRNSKTLSKPLGRGTKNIRPATRIDANLNGRPKTQGAQKFFLHEFHKLTQKGGQVEPLTVTILLLVAPYRFSIWRLAFYLSG
jgi:hypothetical protein